MNNSVKDNTLNSRITLQDIGVGISMSSSFFIKQQAKKRYKLKNLTMRGFQLHCNFKARVGDSFDFTFYSLDHGKVIGRATVKKCDGVYDNPKYSIIRFVYKKVKADGEEILKKVIQATS